MGKRPKKITMSVVKEKKAVKKKPTKKKSAKRKVGAEAGIKRGPYGVKTSEELEETRRTAQNKYVRRIKEEARDISGEQWQKHLKNINWERRRRTSESLQSFCELYMSSIFFFGWSKDQLRCIQRIQDVFRRGGQFALAMPRSGGKTALCRAGLLWGTSSAYRKFPFFIGSSHEKAIQTLAAIKTYWYASRLLRQDFPEIGYSIYRLENRHHLARGQIFYGGSTYVDWSIDHIRYPCMVMPEEDIDVYVQHGLEDFIIQVEVDAGIRYMTKSAGIMIATSGIDGSIRGEAETHPITLEQPRPDIVLLDDVQKDQKAESPTTCAKIIKLIDGAIGGLAGPGKHIAVLMPCTVIRDGDVSDTYLDRSLKPNFRGERCGLVERWPDGITNAEMGFETKAGKAWMRYGELRRQSLRQFGDNRSATEYYADNREIMDENFIITWKDRYTHEGDESGETELSAQQHAMNLRFSYPETFIAEYQNIGRKDDADLPLVITPDQLAEKTIAIPEMEIPVDTHQVSTFIDVQNEIFFYCSLATTSDFSGFIPEYGTYPKIDSRFFQKWNTGGWGLLSKLFFEQYPQHRDKAVMKGGKALAPAEAKIYFGLSVLVPMLLGRQYQRHGTDGFLSPGKIAIDTRWGEMSNVIKKFVSDFGDSRIVTYKGQWFPPTNKQIEEYQLTRGWLFEHQLHPEVKEPMWIWRPEASGGQFYLQCDVNRAKDFLMNRLASPLGGPGSICLYEGNPTHHEMFTHHVCGSEYPEPITARGRTKNLWKERAGSPDNDWLDCLVGCIPLASWQGACLRSTQERAQPAPKRMSITEMWRQQRKKA